jgi:hypothetical protein
MRFDLESSLYEAKQRCFWFIDKYETHGLSPDTFSMISTEMLCDLYNIDINYFKLEK